MILRVVWKAVLFFVLEVDDLEDERFYHMTRGQGTQEVITYKFINIYFQIISVGLKIVWELKHHS